MADFAGCAFDAVIVHFGNGCDRTTRLVRHLVATLPGLRRIIVWDNSPECSTLVSAALPPQVEVRTEGGNLGWGQAVNRALALVESPAALLLNPDVTAAPGAVQACVRRLMEDAAVSVSVPTIRQRRGNVVPLYNIWAILLAEVVGWPATGMLFHPAGVAVTMEVAVVSVRWHRAIGGFDPRFFMYNEDYDWCRRAVAAGGRCVAVATEPCDHEGGASWSASDQRLYWVFDSEARYLAKWFGRTALLVFAVRIVKGALLVAGISLGAHLTGGRRLQYLRMREGIRLSASMRWLGRVIRHRAA